MQYDFWESHFSGMNSQRNWVESAIKLRRGGDLIFNAWFDASGLSDEEKAESDDANLGGVGTLLYELSLENIAKAALLNKGHATVESSGKIIWNVDGAKQHDLVALCETAIGPLDVQLREIVNRLSAFVCWAGKYPTPLGFRGSKDFQGLLLAGQPDSASNLPPFPLTPTERKLVQELWDALKNVGK